MLLADLSVRRPVAILCLIIALVALGFNAYRKLGVEQLPAVDVPILTITTVWPGATPADIEKDIARRIEDAVGRVDGLKHLTNSCMENVCFSFVEFQLGVNIDAAASDVRERLDTVISQFPEGVQRPVILKVDINAKPVLTLALTGDAPIEELYDYADNDLRDRLSVVRGVGNIELVGGSEREVHVLLQRDALAAAGLTSLDVVEATQRGVLTMPAGRVRERGAEYAVRFDAEYDAIAAIGALEAANRNGVRRHIRDLGRVALAAEERRQAAFIDGKPCIGIRVVKRAEANAVAVVRDVRLALEKLRPVLPGGMELVWVADDAAYIRSTVDSTLHDIALGVALTALVLFLFLLNLRTTLIVGVTMPLTIAVSLWFIQLLGYSLNMSTLLAIGLATGILVTNSIIVLENVAQRFADTPNPWEAARKGASEVAIAVIASAGTNVVVLLPIGMMGSMIGVFFRPFALTTLIVNLVSLFISFTLTPILCALLMRSGPAAAPPRLARHAAAWDGFLKRLARRYADLLRLLARRRWVAALILLLALALLVHALSLAPAIGFTFVPATDRGQLIVKLEYPTRVDLAESAARTLEVERRFRDMPELRHLMTTVGKIEGVVGKSSEGVYLAQIYLVFTDKTERRLTIYDLMAEARRRLEGVADCIVGVSIPSLLGGEEIPVEMEIAGEDLAELDRIALRAHALAAGIPGVADPDTSVREGKSELLIRPRRALLSDLNLPIRTLALAARANLEGIEAGSFKRGDRTYDIRIKFDERPGRDQIEQFPIPVGGGRTVTLANFADVERASVPVLITRVDKQRVAKLYASLDKGAPLGNVVNEISRRVEGENMLPAGYTCRFAGQYERMAEGVSGFLEAGILAVLLTYLMLAAVLESFTRPLLIMLTIPLGLIGNLWALRLTGHSMDIFTLLGIVLLVGIVVNIAVLIFNRMEELAHKGLAPRDAMLGAVEDEFHPVLMVTLAAVLGMLPLAIGAGLGSEMRVGIGVASVGGIFVSALLTMIVLPLAYLLMAQAAPKRPE